MRIFLNKASRCFEVSNLESFTPICLSSDTLLSSMQIPLIVSGPMTGPFGYQKQLRLLTETARLVNSTYFHITLTFVLAIACQPLVLNLTKPNFSSSLSLLLADFQSTSKQFEKSLVLLNPLANNFK